MAKKDTWVRHEHVTRGADPCLVVKWTFQFSGTDDHVELVDPGVGPDCIMGTLTSESTVTQLHPGTAASMFRRQEDAYQDAAERAHEARAAAYAEYLETL